MLKKDLLDRVELLNPYQELFSDLRRAYIDHDWNSVFRLLAHYYGMDNDELRQSVVEDNRHSLFRLVGRISEYDFDDLRKAYLENNDRSLFRIILDIDKNDQEENPLNDLRKAILEDNRHSLFRIIEIITDNKQEGNVIDELRKAFVEDNLHSLFRVIGFLGNKKSTKSFTKKQVEDLEDLRKALLEDNKHSVFRLVEKLSDNNFEDLRKAILEDNIHSMFRVMDCLDPNNEILQETKKAVADKNLRATFNVNELLTERMECELAPEYELGDLRKFVLDDNQWSMYRCLNAIEENAGEIIGPLKSMRAAGMRFDRDALSRGQLLSKMWMADELKKLDLDLGVVFLCAGWYGIANLIMHSRDLKIEHVRSFDKDPDVLPIAEKFNKTWVMDSWKFKAVTMDIHEIQYIDFHYPVERSDGSHVVLIDDANTVINTSCEHIENFDDWYKMIPSGTLVVLQSNDYHDVEEHINNVDNLLDFAKQTPMDEVLFSGELNLGEYTRFMRIGYR